MNKKENRNEVVVITFGDQRPYENDPTGLQEQLYDQLLRWAPTDYRKVNGELTIFDGVQMPGDPWPALGDLVRTNQRIVVFVRDPYSSIPFDPLGVLSERDYIHDTWKSRSCSTSCQGVVGDAREMCTTARSEPTKLVLVTVNCSWGKCLSDLAKLCQGHFLESLEACRMALFTSWWALWARVPDFITADWTQNDKHKPNIVNVVKYFNQKRLKEQGSALDILNETASYIGFESGRHGKMISAGIEGSTQRLTDRELWKWKVLPVIYYDDLDYGRRICLRSKYSGQYISSRGGDVGQSKFCGTAPELWRIERYDEDDDHPIGSVGPVQAGDRICLYSEAMHKYVGAIGSDDFGLQDHCRSDESFVVHAAWNDADQDRVIDQGDNCPNTYNPEQTDADENGVGDLCQPVVALCKDVTVSADDECQAHADIDAGSYDPRGNAVTLGYAPEGPYGLGDNDVRLTVTDSLGLSASCSASVTVIDSTPPQFSVTPGPIVVEQTSWDGTPVTVPEPEVQDNCSTVTVDHDAPDVFPLGTTTVTLTAVDAVGNVATATTTVTVQDTTPSILSDVPAPVEVEQVDGDGTPVTLGLPKAWDICDAAPVVTSNAPAVFPLGLTTVTFTATDASGNRATAATTVSVVDTKPPVISSVTASPSELWPPNGKMVSVRVTASAYDIAMHVPSA